MPLCCQALFCGSCDGGECAWIADSQLCKNFAVQQTSNTLEAIDQSAIGYAIDFRGYANALDPKAAEVALAQLAVLIVESKRLHERVFTELKVVFAISVEPFATIEKLLGSSTGCDCIGYSNHGLHSHHNFIHFYLAIIDKARLC